MRVTRETRALRAARLAMRLDRRLRKFTDDHLSEDYAWAYGAARWRPLVVRLSGSRSMRAAAFVAGVEISELVALLLNEYGYGLAGLAGCRMLVSEVMGAPVTAVVWETVE